MPNRNNVADAAALSAKQTMVAAMVTFATSTLPPLHVAATSAVNGMDSTSPTLGWMSDEDQAFYRACVQYTNSLIAKGRYAGPPLRFP